MLKARVIKFNKRFPSTNIRFCVLKLNLGYNNFGSLSNLSGIYYNTYVLYIPAEIDVHTY